MNLRMKTTIDVESKLSELQSSLQVSSKAAVMRLAIAYSLKMKDDPRIIDGVIQHYNIKKQNGSDYIRYTIFGNDEILYKVMFEQQCGKHLNDDEFFPELTYAHISRGIKELYADYKLSNNREKFIKQLIKVIENN